MSVTGEGAESEELAPTEEEDTEEEDTSGDGQINHPFDPNKIRVRSWAPTVYNLMERLKHRELDLAPEFQRRAGIWKEDRQSRLIESLLIRIPLPAFYLDELPPAPGEVTEKFAVVDGVQRLTVLDRFINRREFKLQGLEFLKAQLEGKSFEDLEPPLRRRILETQLAVHIVEPGTPDETKLNIFKRINTGGLSLNAQEIRHAMQPGRVRKLLQTLAGCDEFRKAVGEKIAATMAERMEDRECVLRFVAFLDGGIAHYRTEAKDFDSFLQSAMKRINALSEADCQNLERRFKRTVVAAQAIWGDFAFRKRQNSGRRGRINKALFEATMVNLDARSDEELKQLKSRSAKLLSLYTNILADRTIFLAVTEGTGDPTRVERRFEALKQVIAGTLL